MSHGGCSLNKMSAVSGCYLLSSCVSRAVSGNEWTQWSSGQGACLSCERCGFKSHLVPIFSVKKALREKRWICAFSLQYDDNIWENL